MKQKYLISWVISFSLYLQIIEGTSKSKEPVALHSEFACHQLFHQVHHRGRPTCRKDSVINIVRQRLPDFVLIDETSESVPPISLSLVNRKETFEVGVANLIILKFSLQQDVFFSPIGKKKVDLWSITLRKLYFWDKLNDLIERSDASSPSNQVDVIILLEWHLSIPTLEYCLQLSDTHYFVAKIVESTKR